ncbi:hypothetical protein AAVH_39306, partial [Aphelenchoides avenae]
LPFLERILSTFKILSTSEYESLPWGVVGNTQGFGLSNDDFAELRAIKKWIDGRFKLVGEVPLNTIENVLSGINRTAERATYLTLRALTTRQILAPLIKPPTNHYYAQYWANVLGTTKKEVEKFSRRGMYGLSVQYVSRK